jgi:hypothetical protein
MAGGGCMTPCVIHSHEASQELEKFDVAVKKKVYVCKSIISDQKSENMNEDT